MADGTIWDQTQETALTAAHRVLVQDTNAATASTSATFGLMGGLETNNQTVTTTDITGAVGQLYVCTIAGLTAERSLTLPSAQVGERIGVYIVDGDATYELVVKGAASQTINGGTAATEWSRLFIQGECCVFRCVAANTWIVEYDGRIPCFAKASILSDVTTLAATVETKINLNEELADVGNIFDGTTNNRFNIRRAGVYSCYWTWRSAATAGSFLNSYAEASVRKNGNPFVYGRHYIDDYPWFQHPSISGADEFVVGDYLEAWARGSDVDIDIDENDISTFIHVMESL